MFDKRVSLLKIPETVFSAVLMLKACVSGAWYDS